MQLAGYKLLISKKLPSTLRDLYIFEDFNKLLHPERAAKCGPANRALGKALSKASRSLKNLSATFLVDAEDFFADFWPPNYWSPHASQNSNANVVPWENLRRLTLTSHLLHPTTKSVIIRKLLTAVGRAAAFMPKLEVLEIWNATFTYGGEARQTAGKGLLVSSNTCTAAKNRRLPLQAIGSGRTCRTRWGIIWNTAGRIYRGMDLAISLRLLLRNFRGGRAGLSTIVLQ